MAVEVTETSDRQVVGISWDTSKLDGELAQIFCVNPDNGDVSNSGWSGNDGSGSVSYPEGYSGTTEVTVYDNHGNADYGVISVGEDGEIEEPPTEPVFPSHPIVLPPDSGLTPSHPIVLPEPPESGGEHPAHPIVLPPEIWPDPGKPTHPIVLPDPPEEIGGERPEHPIYLPVFPAHPIVEPPGGYNPPPGANHPSPA